MTASPSLSARPAARSQPVKRLARAGLAARASVYLLVGILAVALAFGGHPTETDQRGALQELTRHTGGTVLVWLIAVGLFGYALWRFCEAVFGVVGVVILGCGVVLVWEGITRKVEKYFQLNTMSHRERTIVEFLGRFGTAARGAVLSLAGVFVIVAAFTANPRKAGGLDRSLGELVRMTAGPFLVVVAGLGLIMFGLYGCAEANWRRT